MQNPEYTRLISQARTDLVTHMAEYVRSQQMPLHLTGEKLRAPAELATLQEVYRRMHMLRERLRLFGGLFQCHDCEHLEGEHHASECKIRANQVVRRPKGWIAPPSSEPAEIVNLTPQPCAHTACPYVCMQGSKFCSQHQDDAPAAAAEVRRGSRVSAQEAIDVMKRIIARSLHVVEASNDHGSSFRVFVTSEGHRLQFFNDAHELDYLEAIRMPDEREGEYDDWCPPHGTEVYNPTDDIDEAALMKALQW